MDQKLEASRRRVAEGLELFQKVKRCGTCLLDEDETFMNSFETQIINDSGFIPSEKQLAMLRKLVAEKCW